MADKKPIESVEKVYIIPLRKTWVKTRRVARAKKCIRVIKEYVTRHTKAKEIYISPKISAEIWQSGPKKPPGKITVKVSVSAGKAMVRLPGEITLEEEKKKFLEAKKKGTGKKAEEITEGKAEDAVAAVPAETPAEEAKEETAAAEKEAPVEEKKEDKKESHSHEKHKKPAAKKENK